MSDICESSVSDHNIYAICKVRIVFCITQKNHPVILSFISQVFLAPNNGSSPLNEGLLFSPPAKYEKLMWKYNKIVKDCVTGQSGDRNLAKTILFDVLDDIEKY